MYKYVIVLFALFGLNHGYHATYFKRQIDQRVCPTVNICGEGECFVTTHPNYEYQYVCRCKTGQYQFTPCSSTTTTTNKCSTNPCYPYLCLEASNVASGYICQCGTNDFRPNPCTGASMCQATSCMNGGSCIYYSSTCSWCANVPAGQTCCVCKPGYTGTKCETATGGTTTTGKCSTTPCGSYPCIETTMFASGFICQCGINDFRPNACSTTTGTGTGTGTTINGCSPNPCKNYGSCVTYDNGQFRGCICPLGYIGTYCETLSSTGTGGTTGTGTGTATCSCLNGGVCSTNSLGQAVCTCKSGYTGSNCGTQYFTCTRNGRFKDQNGCANGKYFECVYYGTSQYPTGILYSRDCPTGLRYNPNADYCDYPENVMC